MFFFFNDTATTEIYTLSLHDALPIYERYSQASPFQQVNVQHISLRTHLARSFPLSSCHQQVPQRSEEHTSELQSRQYLVCRLLLEKKKNIILKIHQLNSHHNNILQNY